MKNNLKFMGGNMTTNEMWQAAKLMKASRSSDQRIAGAELERLARIFELAETVLPPAYKTVFEQARKEEW